ncbi:MAG3240 family lipoprotein [Mycoplasma miroungirhinis]|uniref:Lipoprotein n=1 Tax=Mycoplasma miroungirhinis TaxID=754516 RepID=A0A6M4JDK6_9MOLU|nr:hypothetical protein [Mycoplasma miroungirhinis]QJR44405.1 hypothetical protein HLA92_03125 [Mycoplasma miroungirhinis]
MLKKNKLFLGFVLPLFSLSCLICLSCNTQNLNNNDINEKIIDKNLLMSFNNKQINILNDFYPFLNKDVQNFNNDNTYYDIFKHKKPKINELGIEIGEEEIIDAIKTKEASKIDINDFFIQFDKDIIKTTTNYSPWITNTLPTVYNIRYSEVGLKPFPDIQSLIYKIIDDMQNGTWSKVSHLKFFDGYFYNLNTIRLKSWTNNLLQKKMWETLLLTYINYFNTDVVKLNIKINKEDIFDNENDNMVSFSIDCFDKNNQSLLTNENKNKKFYLFGFKNYLNDPKFGVFENIDNLKLFNEYLVSPILKFKLNNIYSVNDINSFVNNVFSPEFISGDSFNYFLNKHSDLIELEVPEYKKNTDKAYRFVSSEVASFFGTRQLLKIKIEVIHQDDSKEYFWWLSSDFDDHGHKMKPLINKIKNQLLFETFNPNLEKFNLQKDTFQLKINKQEKRDFMGIEANEFFESDLFKSILKTIDQLPIKHIKMANNLRLWNNNIKSNFEAGWLTYDSEAFKYFETWLNLFVLQYAINTHKDDINTMLNHIKVEIATLPYSAGQVALKFHFIALQNSKEIELLNQQNQDKIILWNGFKGYDKTKNKPFTF